jgi:hypothetical protein
MAISVLRYSSADAITLLLPFEEMVVQAWTLLKVTATPYTRRSSPDAQAPRGSDSAVMKPLRGIGGFFALALDTFAAIFKPPFAFRDLLEHTAKVSDVGVVA